MISPITKKQQTTTSSGSMADATLNQSWAWSLPTAACHHNQNGAYHMGTLVMWRSSGGSKGNIFAVVEQEKNTT